MGRIIRASRSIGLLVLILMISGYSGYVKAQSSDSIRIVNAITSRFKAVRSGHIQFVESTKDFFHSHATKLNSDLYYSLSDGDVSTLVLLLERSEKETGLTISDAFYRDTSFESFSPKKEVLVKPEAASDFVDDFDDTFWLYSFGFYPRSAADLFIGEGHFSFSDTLIGDDRCYKIMSTSYHPYPEIDSTVRIWIVSLNDCSHSAYYRTSWGYGGNISEFSQTCLNGEYSEDYDSLVIQKAKSRISSFSRDSGYPVIRDTNSNSTVLETHEKENKLKEGNLFPISHFQTMDNAEVGLATPGQKITLLDFSYMGCDPCRMSIPGISRIYQKYRDSGVAVYCIDPYDKNEPEILARYSKKYHLDYPVLFSDKHTVFDSLGIDGFPTFIILDDTLKIRYISTGFGAFREGVWD